MAELINDMRTFLITIILLFNIQSFVKADDIRNYEIEGISIGESVLRPGNPLRTYMESPSSPP